MRFGFKVFVTAAAAPSTTNGSFVLLTRLPLSTAGPAFMILGAVTSAAIGASIFGEFLGPLKLLGTIVCIAGVGLIFYDTVR